jgi:hypothetical protein
MASPAEIFLERVRKGLDDHLDVVWPGSGDVVGIMVPLNCSEIDAATAAAIAHFRELGIDVNLFSVTQDEYGSEACLQCVARAFRTKEDREKRVFESADQARESLRPDERTLLTRAYVELMKRVNPAPEALPEKLVDEVVETVKKKGEGQSNESG